jgi:LOB domain-containing protein 29
MALQTQLASLTAQGQQRVHDVDDDAKGYVGSAAAEHLGRSSNGSVAPATYGNGGHESLTALLGSESDCLQQSPCHAFEHAGADDNGRQGNTFEAAADSSSFGAEESGWRSLSGYRLPRLRGPAERGLRLPEPSLVKELRTTYS